MPPTLGYAGVNADLIGGEWTPFVGDIFKECKLRWHYRVPADADRRNRLRALCERTLEFENFTLEQCQRYFTRLTEEGSASQQAEAKARLRRLAANDSV